MTPTERLIDIAEDHEKRIGALETTVGLFESKFEERVEAAIVNAARRLATPKNLSKIAGFVSSLYAVLQVIQKVM
ncbi:MAG: hypothetical protein M5U09_12435 [Gammaproteobacteria bacterium]|nr:hypothetical protein [Gammaproteobacteria bacterium]